MLTCGPHKTLSKTQGSSMMGHDVVAVGIVVVVVVTVIVVVLVVVHFTTCNRLGCR